MYPSAVNRERYADGIIHIVGLIAVVIGCTLLLRFAVIELETPLILACALYTLAMIASFGGSASYHLLPQHHWRKRLRKLDHVAIYALIAGTFTPLMAKIGTPFAYGVLAAVWIFAIPAMLYKLFGKNIDSRWSLVSYIGLGWFGTITLPDMIATFPFDAMIAIALGGFFYSFGTIFYSRKTLAYRYAIWHFFGLLGTAFFFAGIWLALFT